MPDFVNQSDRDLLIQTATNTENLCTQFKNLKEENKKDHEAIREDNKETFATIFSLFEKRVPNWVFFPIIIIIVGGLISLAAYTSKIKNDVAKNTVCIEKLEN